MTILLTFILIGMISINSNAQALSENLKSADVIYVAPMTGFDYYAIKRGAGQGIKGAYSHDAKYVVGDYLDDATDPNVSYEVVGAFSKEMLAALNEQVLKQLKSIYGEDKVKPWPSEVKNKMTGLWDQKKIDCKYYIIFKRMTSNKPVAVTFFDASSVNPDSKPMVVGGSDMFTIKLYEKVKTGKKGKAIVKANHKIFKGVDPVLMSADYKADAAKLISMSNENFPKLVESTVSEFVAEISSK